MTKAGKTSTDIHMVLDIIDVLQASTRYDEFIVFSADADFTPVLRKLRREDRRTTIFAAGATSASYDASADLIVDLDAFIHDALGFDDEEAARETPNLESLLAQAEGLVWETVDNADQPVPLPGLTKILATRIPALPATEWAGKGTFFALLKSLPLDPLRIDREENTLLDPRRLNGHANGTTAARVVMPSGSPNKSDPRQAAQVADQLSRLIADEVAESNRPIAVARLAQLARAEFPGIEVTWLGHGSWKKLLESLRPPHVKIVWQQLAGWALDPDRHTLDLAAAGTVAHVSAADSARAAKVSRLLEAVDLPLLEPAKYRAQLEALSMALDDQPYVLTNVTKSMRDHCQRLGQPVSREQCLRLLRTLVYDGFNPEADPHGFEDLVAMTCGVIVSACDREGVPVDDADRFELLQWMTDQEAEAVE
ncbi:NYN domain-containing protein [Sphaerotilus hippei]|uniref:NYN domain-containing protein n=2 Tax=Sphaerotilus hippei TaxID=744406 RepID=A0A318GY17_9BURK|nr:NYN domain-containing protein [Sphaerotilus hippei]